MSKPIYISEKDDKLVSMKERPVTICRRCFMEINHHGTSCNPPASKMSYEEIFERSSGFNDIHDMEMEMNPS